MKTLKCKLPFGFLCAILLHLIAVVSTEKILFLLPITTKSQKNVFDPLYKALADRDHEITLVSPSRLATPHENIREIVPLNYDQLFGTALYIDAFTRRRQGKYSNALSNFNFDFAVRATDKIYQNQEFMGLLDVDEEPFDLIITSIFMSHGFSGLIHKLGSPFISVATVAAPNFVTYATGNHLPYSFVPFVACPFTDEMSFFERVLNILMSGYVMNPRLFQPFEDLYRKYLGEDIPDLYTLERNASLVFSNSHFALTSPRPLLPDVVEVGGMHCGPPKPLPKDLNEYLSAEPEHGFIYFSMGTVVNTDQFPDDLRQKFVNVFSRLKQRVIWKWNSGHIEGLPENIRVSKWLPQQDILGHPNIRVFMTHGGLLSTQEAAYHGVPLIGIPMVADQDLNMKQAESSGYALTLEILDMTEEILEGLLQKVLHDPQYAAKAKELSSITKDQLQTPLERAIYWTEYVMRHKGAHHLRSAARELNFFQYHSLDVIAALAAVLLAIIFIVKIILVKLIRTIFYIIIGKNKNCNTVLRKGKKN